MKASFVCMGSASIGRQFLFRLVRSGTRPFGTSYLLLILCFGMPTASVAGPLSNWYEQLKSRPYYLQLQTGFASDADFGPSLIFLTDRSPERTDYFGLSLGSQFSDSVFGWPAEVVVFLGLQNFLENGVQPDSVGLTAYWKIYYQWLPPWINTNLPIRFGLGQGLSYVSRIPVVEQRDFLPDQSEKLVHYLEWSMQLPVGGLLEVFGFDAGQLLHSSWLGYSIFHRSTVFGLFAETGGGINYPGVTLEFVF